MVTSGDRRNIAMFRVSNPTMKMLFAMIILALAAADPARIAFDIHDGYFVSNKFEPDEPTSFVVLKDQKAFDEVFGVAFVMRDNAHRLPADAFKARMVVAAIHRGKALWKYKVEGVEARDGTLILRYSTTVTPSETATFACPLIVSVDKAGYAAVQVVEDGKEATKIDLRPATTRPAAPPRIKSNMKGWELYIWQQNGTTFYKLMEGTNRLKRDDEIAQGAVKSADEIKRQLDELKRGEFVTISGRRDGAAPPPPQPAAAEITDYCRKIGLRLPGDPEPVPARR